MKIHVEELVGIVGKVTKVIQIVWMFSFLFQISKKTSTPDCKPRSSYRSFSLCFTSGKFVSDCLQKWQIVLACYLFKMYLQTIIGMCEVKFRYRLVTCAPTDCTFFIIISLTSRYTFNLLMGNQACTVNFYFWILIKVKGFNLVL